MLLPDELQKVEKEYSRNYYILRYHDGEVEKLDATLSDDGTYLEFESDKFSIFSLVYEDTLIVENPNTSDFISKYILLGVLAVISMVVSGLMIIRKKYI